MIEKEKLKNWKETPVNVVSLEPSEIIYQEQSDSLGWIFYKFILHEDQELIIRYSDVDVALRDLKD